MLNTRAAFRPHFVHLIGLSLSTTWRYFSVRWSDGQAYSYIGTVTFQQVKYYLRLLLFLPRTYGNVGALAMSSSARIPHCQRKTQSVPCSPTAARSIRLLRESAQLARAACTATSRSPQAILWNSLIASLHEQCLSHFRQTGQKALAQVQPCWSSISNLPKSKQSQQQVQPSIAND